MFSTCLFCHGGLGKNEVVEHFPVGSRLAFDSARGRLWAVCPQCRRWNLSPLDERWEAIDECERLFRGTRARTSTDATAASRPVNSSHSASRCGIGLATVTLAAGGVCAADAAGAF